MEARYALPQGWRWNKLGEVCEVVTGTTPSKSDLANYGNYLPFFKPPHLWDNAIFESDEMLSQKGSTKARIVPINTVLVTCIGNLGRTGFVKNESTFNQQINAILENSEIIGKYIFYQAQSPFFKKQLEKLATGTTVSIVNKTNFETIEIPIPPLSTQHLIVAKIEELFSELDKGIEDLKLAQQQLKTYRQSVLKWAFEGKLTNAKVKEGELPKGWIVIRLGDVANSVDPQPSHRTPPIVQGGIPYVSIKDFNSELDIIDFSRARRVSENILAEHVNRYTLEIGDFVIGKIGTIGKPVRIVLPQNYTLSANVVLIQPRKINPTFLYYYFQSSKIQKAFTAGIKATTQAAFGIQKVRELQVQMPIENEQFLIVQEIESRLSVADKMEESITQSLQQAEALRQSILKKAFEGKLVC